MASAKDLRKRIASVKNTQQITKAMKMVSAAKLRKAQEAIVKLRPYAYQIGGVVKSLAQNQEVGQNPLLMSGKKEKQEKLLLIVVTSDRGLCGSFNASIIKATQKFLKTHSQTYKAVSLGFVGKKGYEFFKNRYSDHKYYQNFFLGLNYSKSVGLAEELIKAYLANEFDDVKFIYNEFKSAISQKVVIEDFLPVPVSSLEGEISSKSDTIFEPNQAEILNKLLPRHYATQVHRVMLESLASEHGSRMSAMENATKNAGEMMYKLTLEYNKTRQASITKELLEITSGSEAQKG